MKMRKIAELQEDGIGEDGSRYGKEERKRWQDNIKWDKVYMY